MRSRTSHFLWLALLAWAAQLCLPFAHSMAMARADAGVAAWCGPASTALEAKISLLPHEVRNIIAPGSSAWERQLQCEQSCANGLGHLAVRDVNTVSPDVWPSYHGKAVAPDSIPSGPQNVLGARGPPNFS